MVQKGLKEVGYSYVNIDDGFFGWRDERGVMQTHPERFPNGLKGVADHIHSLGLKAGIYIHIGIAHFFQPFLHHSIRLSYY